MATMPLADAARLLGKPERTIRRWAANGRLPATRTADGWLIELELDEHGQVAATDRINGHTSGRTASRGTANGGHLAMVPVTLLQDLMGKAEQAAYWQGRASVLETRIQELEQQLALPAPPAENGSATAKRPWWRLW